MKKDDPMLFPWIEQQKKDFLTKHDLKKSDLINLGIGDTCHNLPKCISDALHDAVKKMCNEPIGYGPEQGRLFLRNKIRETIYPERNFSEDEIFVTEGIANSLSLLLSLFKEGSDIGVLSPTYPVYKSLLNVSYMNITEIPANDDLSFSPPEKKLDAVIICSPNNPTGIAFTKDQLKEWVNWAKENKTLILFDSAYESFISSKNAPRSIYEIEGAKEVAIEMRSFSKSLGFSGLRLGYFTTPKELIYQNRSVLALCSTIIAAKTNGVSYLIQEAGMAALSPTGQEEMKRLSAHYMNMITQLKDHLVKKEQTVLGGSDAPYLFWQVGGSSKENFVRLLQEHRLITIPGIGFGKDGYLRLSGFINDDILKRACNALTSAFQ